MIDRHKVHGVQGPELSGVMEVPGVWVEVAEQTRPFQLYLSWDRGGRASGAVLGRLNFHPLRWGGLKDFALENNAVRFTTESDTCGMNRWTLKAPQHLYKQRGPCCLKLCTEIPALLPCNYLRHCSESRIEDWLPACRNINIPCFCKPRALSSAVRPLTALWFSGWPLPGPRRVASREGAAAGGPGGTLCRVPRLPAVPEGGQDGQDPVGVHRPPDHPGPAPGGAECIRDPDQVSLHADPGVAQPGE